MIERRVQEALRQLRVAEPALAQEARDDRRDLQRRRQRRGRGVVAGERVPPRGDVGISGWSSACSRKRLTTEDTEDTEDTAHAARNDRPNGSSAPR